MNLIEKVGEFLVFRAGKHRGETLETVARNDPKYLRWLRNDDAAEDLTDEAFELLEQTMKNYNIPLERYRRKPR